MSGYLHALWAEGLQEHRYKKVNTRSTKSSSPLESLTRSVYHTDQTWQTSDIYINHQMIMLYTKRELSVCVFIVIYWKKKKLNIQEEKKLSFTVTDSATGVRMAVCACSYMRACVYSSSHYLGSLQVRAQQAIWTGDPHPAAHYGPHRKLQMRAPDVHGW